MGLLKGKKIPPRFIRGKTQRQVGITSQLISVYESGWCPAGNGSRAPETLG